MGVLRKIGGWCLAHHLGSWNALKGISSIRGLIRHLWNIENGTIFYKNRNSLRLFTTFAKYSFLTGLWMLLCALHLYISMINTQSRQFQSNVKVVNWTAYKHLIQDASSPGNAKFFSLPFVLIQKYQACTHVSTNTYCIRTKKKFERKHCVKLIIQTASSVNVLSRHLELYLGPCQISAMETFLWN